MIQGRFRNLALMLADAACISACWAIVVFAYHYFGGYYDPRIYLRFWPVIPAFVFINALFRLYHGSLVYPSASVSPVEELRRLVGSSFLLHAGVFTVLVLLHQTTQGYSRVVIVLSGLLTAALVHPFREVCRWLLWRCPFGRIPVAIYGAGPAAQRMVKAMESDSYAGLKPAGYFDNDARALGEVPCWGGLRDAVSECRRRGVKILFACVDERIFRSQLAELTEWFTYIEYFPSVEVFPIFGSRAISIGGVGGLEMVNQDRMRELRLEKWLMDKSLALLAFILLSPLMLAIGILVRITSPGPAFFRHPRLGRNGKPIRIWKFRTMFADADVRLEKLLAENPQLAEEWRENHKLKDDPRVTPFGRFLRKTSLDEIPQFFNVLAGSMALVGPRPIVQDEVEKYGSAYPIFASARPGVTGLWQVSGRSETDYSRRVALDTYYVLNWSPWLDLLILMRTFVAVFLMRGAR